LANDKLDQNDMKRMTNPFSINGLTIPAKVQNYPIILPKIDLLVGEEMGRRFDWRVIVTNSDAVTQKERDIKRIIDDTLVNIVTQGSIDEDDFNQRMKRIDRFKKYEYRDIRERRATQLLKYLYNKENLETKFSKNFLDLLIGSEELGCADIVAGEPVFRKLNPLQVHAISNGESPYLEDAEIIIEDGYYPPGKVIDMFHDELTEADTKRILDGDLTSTGGSRFSLGERERSIIPTGEFETIFDPDTGFLEETLHNDGENGYRGAFDLDGNVRVMRVVWKGSIPIWKVTYQDPITGEMEEDIMPEGWKRPKGVTAKKIWISNWYEGTMIGSGKDSIKLKYGSRPIQFRSMDNMSECKSGYVGTYMNINDSRAYSLMDRMKPYQYLYNIYMYRTEQAFAKSMGKVLQLPSHLIPDDWDLDQWLNYLYQMNIMVVDYFKEGDKGVAEGKISGSLAPNNYVADLEMGNYIQQHLSMLEWIKKEVSEIAGVTEQRQGQIEQRELVGNVQRAVTQSAHITEKWFKAHEDYKRRALTLLLETAKFAYKNKKLKRQFIMDDMTNVLFDIPGDEIMEADYGLFINNSTNDTRLYEDLRMLSQALVQNDKITASNMIDIYSSDSIQSIKRKLETFEEETRQREYEMQKQQIQAQQQQIQQQAQLEQEKLALDERKNVRDNQTKLLIEELRLRAEAIAENGDDNGMISADMKKHKDEMAYKLKELEETIKQQNLERQKEIKENQKDRTLEEKLHKEKMVVERKKASRPTSSKSSK